MNIIINKKLLLIVILIITTNRLKFLKLNLRSAIILKLRNAKHSRTPLKKTKTK